MALDALWSVLTPEVSGVSRVQAPVHASLLDTPAVLPEVSGVSSNGINGPCVTAIGGIDTPDTPSENVRYQQQPAWALGCTLDTLDTPEEINIEAHAANELLSDKQLTAEPTKPKRIFDKRGPWLNDTEKSAARAYHAHHFNCHPGIAAGRGNRHGRRCAGGLALWNTYLRGLPQLPIE